MGITRVLSLRTAEIRRALLRPTTLWCYASLVLYLVLDRTNNNYFQPVVGVTTCVLSLRTAEIRRALWDPPPCGATHSLGWFCFVIRSGDSSVRLRRRAREIWTCSCFCCQKLDVLLLMLLCVVPVFTQGYMWPTLLSVSSFSSRIDAPLQERRHSLSQWVVSYQCSFIRFGWCRLVSTLVLLHLLLFNIVSFLSVGFSHSFMIVTWFEVCPFNICFNCY